MGEGKEIQIRTTTDALFEFVSKLLGSRRSIERSFDPITLFVTYEWIVNAVNIIDQRLEQNKHALAPFECKYYFDSGKVLTVYDRDNFRSFSDNSTSETLGVDISLSYLIEFPNTATPERQDIRLQIFSQVWIKDKIMKAARNRTPLITYKIDFTNLTWGEDISAHLNRHVEEIIASDGLGRSFLVMNRYSSEILGTLVIIGILLLASLFLYGLNNTSIETNIHNAELRKAVSDLGADGGLVSLNKKIDLMILAPLKDQSLVLTWANWRPLAFLAGIILLIGAPIYLNTIGNAYVVACNRYTEKIRQTTITRRQNLKWLIVGGFFVGIIATIVGSHLDALIF